MSRNNNILKVPVSSFEDGVDVIPVINRSKVGRDMASTVLDLESRMIPVHVARARGDAVAFLGEDYSHFTTGDKADESKQ